MVDPNPDHPPPVATYYIALNTILTIVGTMVAQPWVYSPDKQERVDKALDFANAHHLGWP